MEADTQSNTGSVYVLDGHAVVTYGDRTLQADHIEYNNDTGETRLTGHLLVTGGENDEEIHASHGTINVRTQVGQFYDVTGSVGMKPKPKSTTGGAAAGQRAVYANGNPFLFTGKMVAKTGPREYQVYNGTVTSCLLPRPDWLLSGAEFSVDAEKARASNSIFHLMSLPVLWLPYVTHPLDANERQSGILIPEIGFNSASYGETVGEQVYWSINRSTDLTLGTIFYSARGWEQMAGFHYRGAGQDFATSHYSALLDRGYTPPGGTYINQSGTDVVFSGRRDFLVDPGPVLPGAASEESPPVQARAVVDVEYLSSFPYREAFSTNFNEAVSTDVNSTIYATREWDDMSVSLEGDCYQGEKRIATTVPLQAEEQVHIFHAPSLEFAAGDHELGSTRLEWNMDSSLTALKRAQPGFVTSGMVERLDVRPEAAYPLHFDGWSVRPAVAGRETFYSRSRIPGVPGVPGVPIESQASLNRTDVEMQVDVRPPILERTFDSGFLKRLLRHEVKHTIEPELIYRFVNGIDNFPDVLRFDMVDVASDTNEIEYGVTQRLFLHRNATGARPCRAPDSVADATDILGAAGGEDATEPGEAANRTNASEPVCGNREWISWRVAQKYFFNPSFGGAVTNGPRSILDTTLDFSGIAFMTRPRDISPLISRLRVRTSEKTDVEWDFDYDTCAASSAVTQSAATSGCYRKFTANNLYVDVHQSDVFAGVSVARLNAPARSYVEGVLSTVADFTQMRVRFGFRDPTKAGLSAATSAGIDLDLGTVQYGAIQTAYNWNCCGISMEYSKYELGTARNDNGYKFSFTLANIGSAGNLRHSQQVF